MDLTFLSKCIQSIMMGWRINLLLSLYLVLFLVSQDNSDPTKSLYGFWESLSFGPILRNQTVV